MLAEEEQDFVLVVVDVDVDDTVVWSIQSILHFWLLGWSLKWSMASSSRQPEWSHTSFVYRSIHKLSRAFSPDSSNLPFLLRDYRKSLILYIHSRITSSTAKNNRGCTAQSSSWTFRILPHPVVLDYQMTTRWHFWWIPTLTFTSKDWDAASVPGDSNLVISWVRAQANHKS